MLLPRSLVLGPRISHKTRQRRCPEEAINHHAREGVPSGLGGACPPRVPMEGELGLHFVRGER